MNMRTRRNEDEQDEMVADDDNSNIPSLFKKRYVSIHIGIFVAVCININYFDLPRLSGLDKNTAINFLNTNIEILVAIFAVTLGVTLLGLQFRTQSYTILALMQYVKDVAIYCFVVIFIVLIMFSMLAATQPAWIDPVPAVLYVIVATFFSLLYTVGYVYHMIDRTEPEQVIRRLKKDIQRITASEIAEKYDTLSKKLEPFHVWEQIMLRAVESNNPYVFSSGIRLIGDAASRFMTSCNDDKKDAVGGFFIQQVVTILDSAVRMDRKRLVRIFMDRFERTNEPIPEEADVYESKRMIMFHLWQWILYESIVHNNRWIQQSSLDSMNKVVDAYMSRSQKCDIGSIALFLHTYMARPVYNAIIEGRDNFLKMYIEDWSRYHPLFTKHYKIRRSLVFFYSDCCLGANDGVFRTNRK